jgi:hypothetical protein
MSLVSLKDVQATGGKREHPELQKMYVFFALLDPDPDPAAPLNPDRIRIHITDN